MQSHKIKSQLSTYKILPPMYFKLFLILGIAIHYLIPSKEIIPSPYTYIGIVFIVDGLIANIWSALIFKKNKIATKQSKKSIKLINAGPFKYSRNPMYLGMIMILFGLAIYIGSIGFFIAPIGMFLVLNMLFIPIEEHDLEKTFGNNYSNYKKNVRRWI